MDSKKIIKIFISLVLYFTMISIAIVLSKYVYYKPYKISEGHYSIFSPILYARKLINSISIIYMVFYLWRIFIKKDFFYLINVVLVCIFLFCVNYFIYNLI